MLTIVKVVNSSLIHPYFRNILHTLWLCQTTFSTVHDVVVVIHRLLCNHLIELRINNSWILTHLHHLNCVSYPFLVYFDFRFKTFCYESIFYSGRFLWWVFSLRVGPHFLINNNPTEFVYRWHFLHLFHFLLYYFLC